MESREESGLRIRNRRLTAGVLTPLGAIGVFVIMFLSVGTTAATPSPTQPNNVLTTIPGLDAIAANSTVVFAQAEQNCSQIWGIAPWDAVGIYAHVPITNANCTQGSLVIAPANTSCGNLSLGINAPAAASRSGPAVYGAWTSSCPPCPCVADDLYDVTGGSLFQISDWGTIVTTMDTFPVPIVPRENMGLTYDQVGTFDHDLIVTSSDTGNIWLVNITTYAVTPFLKMGTYISSPAVAPMSFGSLGGDLLVAVKHNSQVDAITPGGIISVVTHWKFANSVAFSTSNNTFGPDNDVFFVANYTSGALEAYTASQLAPYAGLGFVAGGHDAGIAAFNSLGVKTLFGTGTDRVSAIAFITANPACCCCHTC